MLRLKEKHREAIAAFEACEDGYLDLMDDRQALVDDLDRGWGSPEATFPAIDRVDVLIANQKLVLDQFKQAADVAWQARMRHRRKPSYIIARLTRPIRRLLRV